MKNQILLNHYYLPSELEEQLHRFVSYYNHNRYHESIDNLTAADVYYGRGIAILTLRKRIKLNTIASRRKNYYDRQRSHNLMNETLSQIRPRTVQVSLTTYSWLQNGSPSAAWGGWYLCTIILAKRKRTRINTTPIHARLEAINRSLRYETTTPQTTSKIR